MGKSAKKSAVTQRPPRGARSRTKRRQPERADLELAKLRSSLEEAQATLEAIRTGEVDAIVVNGRQGSHVYTLAGAEQPYRIFVERMQEGAITVSQQGLILYSNQRYAEMVQTPLERVIGTTLQSHLGSIEWAKFNAIFTGKGEVGKHEALLRRSDGSALAVQLTASQLPGLKEDVMCMVLTDLTAQKAQQDLQLARDVAEKANLAKDAFLATLSHELRTPLTPVLMAAVALTQQAELPDLVRRDLAMIRRNIELEARLIDDLLDLTRIAKGKLELHFSSFDVHSVLKRAVEICRPDIVAKHQRLSLHLDAEYPQTHGDPVRLQQVFWNLIRNAIKFTAPSGSIAIHAENTMGGGLRVEVRDTGIGFEPENAPKLFRAFEQGGREVTRQFGGLGLGLAISSSIIEAHGGQIEATSPGRNQGATFAVTLPHRPATLAPPAAARVATSPARKTRACQILLVEDHKDTRRTLQLHLQAARHTVKAAATAKEALELAAANKFDVVISDIGLPDEGGGLALMAQLRDRYRLRGIAVSGFGMEEDIAQSRAAGFRHHLTKPINLDQLKELIAQTESA